MIGINKNGGFMRKSIALFLIILGVISFLIPAKSSFSQEKKKTLYVIPIEGTIDLGLSAFVMRALKLAKENNAAAVVLKINSIQFTVLWKKRATHCLSTDQHPIHPPP